MELIGICIAIFLAYRCGILLRRIRGPEQDKLIRHIFHVYIANPKAMTICIVDGYARGFAIVLATLIWDVALVAEFLVLHTCLTAAVLMTAMQRYRRKAL